MESIPPIKEKREEAMGSQRHLLLDGQQPIEALWERFPTSPREELVNQYVELVARAIRSAACPQERKEHANVKHDQ